MACVYAIRNSVNTKLYVGSTIGKAKTRFASHKAGLHNGNHHSKRLQHDWNRYGKSAFEFIIIEECKPDDCEVLEDYWIEYYNSSSVNNGYNVKPRSHRRKEMSEEERKDCKSAFYVIDIERLRRVIEARGKA